MSFAPGDPRARRAGARSAVARSGVEAKVDRYIVLGLAEHQLLSELREAGSAAVRALRLRSPDAATALESYITAHAATTGKRESLPTEGA